jgi:transposase
MQLALEGRMTEHPGWMLRLQREQLEFLEAQIAKSDAKIQEHMSDYQKAVDLCTTIPGIEAIAAANLIGEIGVNMDPFSTLSIARRAAPNRTQSRTRLRAATPLSGMRPLGTRIFS